MKIDVLKPEFTHLKTIIFLHYFNQRDEEIYRIINDLNNKKRGIKFIIPISVKNNINSWYKYYTWNNNLLKHDSICLKDFNSNVSIVKDLIEEECKIIDPSKIFIIGISQGGTIAIDVSLKLSFKIKKVICIDTIFLDSYFSGNYTKQVFSIFQSLRDDVYNPKFQDICYKKLSDNNCEVNKITYDLSHTENINIILDFINVNIV